MYTINDCSIIDLEKMTSDRGSLTVAESGRHIPFEIKRVYYTYDIPAEASRGGHAHIEQHELVIAASGSFNVIVDDGTTKKIVFLNNPNKGLLLKPGIWRELTDFSAGGIVLVLNSGLYIEEDYIREYDKFLNTK